MAPGLQASTHRPGVAAEAISLLRPANLLAALLVILGWAALISWTGNGPGGWQARTCAGLAPSAHACVTATRAKDAGRVVPHTAEQAS